MNVHEGRGFLIHTGIDTPFKGWLTACQLDACVPIASASWEALRNLADLSCLMPGGLSLIWNAPVSWINNLNYDVRAGFIKGLEHIPGMTLHICDDSFATLIQEPSTIWYHSTTPPNGAIGLAWRKGWLGWTSEDWSGWFLSGSGNSVSNKILEQGDMLASYLWGEVILPLGALEHLDSAEVAAVMAERQGQVEHGFSQRIDAEAWPVPFPFQRRRTGWRVSLLGGREFQMSGGSWERAATLVKAFTRSLGEILRCRIYLAVSDDLSAAITLGQQAMWEGLPWRSTLPLPPEVPSFTPGLGSNPREPSSIETRSMFPAVIAKILDESPIVCLRVPGIPMDTAIKVFLEGMDYAPAIKWLPPGIAPPGPFLSSSVWAPAQSYPILVDTTNVVQPLLFDDLS
jgi:hypothetical protein